MIALDTWDGFLILLTIPLLYWHQRVRSARKSALLSIYPILTRAAPADRPLPRRLLRLTRNQRFILFTAAMLSLALCYNGIHVTSRGQEAGTWLVLVDNTPGMSALFEGKAIIEETTAYLKKFPKKTREADGFVLLTTSPSPRVSGDLDAGSFVEELGKMEVSGTDTDIEDLVSLLEAVNAGMTFKGTILITARAPAWEERLAARGLRNVAVPGNLGILTGNAGFAFVEITPVTGDLYEVYGKIASRNLETGTIRAVFRTDGGGESAFLVPLSDIGDGELRFTRPLQPASRATLRLELEDTLTGDNTVTLIPPASGGVTGTRITGAPGPFIEMALSSHSGFHLLSEGDPGPAGRTTVSIRYKAKALEKVETPTLIIFPTEEVPGFDLSRIWTSPMEVTFHPGHPATANARFRQFRAARILQMNHPENFEALATAEGIPIILSGTMNGHRTVLWGFDPADNGIYMDPAFPVLLRDTVTWLGRSGEVVIESEGCAGTRVDPQTCSSLIRESATVNIPDLSDLDGLILKPDSDNRRDLGKGFLLIALLLILVLAAERVPGLGAVLR